jgi:hypothetical protein
VPEQEERAIETNTEGSRSARDSDRDIDANARVSGDNAMGLDEGVPQVRVKVENTPLGKAQAAPVKSESQGTFPPYSSNTYPTTIMLIGLIRNSHVRSFQRSPFSPPNWCGGQCLRNRSLQISIPWYASSWSSDIYLTTSMLR